MNLYKCTVEIAIGASENIVNLIHNDKNSRILKRSLPEIVM